MATCLLGWNDYTKPYLLNGVNSSRVPTISGPAWNTSYPLSNLLQAALYQVARTVDTTIGNTKFAINLTGGLSGSVPVRLVALVRHNIKPLLASLGGAKLRVTLGTDPTFATWSYQSAWVSVWSNAYAPGSLPSGWNPAWFTGAPFYPDLQRFSSLTYVHDAGQNYVVSELQVELDFQGDTNDVGYLELGGVAAMSGWQPRLNMTYGATLGWDDPSTMEESDSGVQLWNERPLRRIAQFTLANEALDEMMELGFQLPASAGKSRPLLFVLDPSSAYHMHRWSFLARLDALDALTLSNPNMIDQTIRLREVV